MATVEQAVATIHLSFPHEVGNRNCKPPAGHRLPTQGFGIQPKKEPSRTKARDGSLQLRRRTIPG